jgi:hypothetical protein
MSTVINPTGTPNDPRIGGEQTHSQGSRRRSDSDPAKQSTDAAKVTISHQAEAVSEKLRLVQSENVASAASSVADISRASELVKEVAQQISAQPAAALSAQARIDPKSALNLLS